MSRIFTVIKYMILQNLRDTGNTVGQMIIFPIVLIFILGMALSPVYEHQQMEATLVGYLNEDQGTMGGLLDDFLAIPEIAEFLDVREIASRDEGLELIKDGEITALIHVDKDYSAKIMAGEPAEIMITGHPGRKLGVTMVETVMESFVYGGNAVHAMVVMGNPQPEYAPASDSIEDYPIAASGLMPNAMGYYAVTMLVLIAMYGSMSAAYGLAQNNMAPVGLRVKATPIRPWEQYIGVILGNVVTVFIGCLIVVAFTHYVYGVSWGDNLPMIVLIIFIHVFLAIGFGTMAITVTRDASRASALLNGVVITSTIIAGGYFKITLPSAVGWVQYLSPNFLTQTALFNTVYDGPARQTMVMLVAMTGIIVVSFAVSMLAERRSVR